MAGGKIVIKGKAYNPAVPGAVQVAGGDSEEVISAPASTQELQVFGLLVTAAAATTVQFKSGTNPIGAPWDVSPSGPITLQISAGNVPWLIANPGEALNADAGAGGGVSIHAVYIAADVQESE